MPVRHKFFLPPRDRSLQAFKDWMQSKFYHLNPNATGMMILEPWISNQQWIAYWKKFWEKVDGAHASRKSSEG